MSPKARKMEEIGRKRSFGGRLVAMTTYFDKEFEEKVDRFALNLVKEYRRYVAGEGYADEQTTRLFGCSVFAHYLARCNHEQKQLLKHKGIPIDEGKCSRNRHHFFLCTGSVYCNDRTENLISCVKRNGVSSGSEMKDKCIVEYESFLDCYLTKVNKDYPTTPQPIPAQKTVQVRQRSWIWRVSLT